MKALIEKAVNLGAYFLTFAIELAIMTRFYFWHGDFFSHDATVQHLIIICANSVILTALWKGSNRDPGRTPIAEDPA